MAQFSPKNKVFLENSGSRRQKKTAKERASDVEVGAGGTDMNSDFYGGDFKIDLNEPELG